MTKLNVKSTGYFAMNTVVQVVGHPDLLDVLFPEYWNTPYEQRPSYETMSDAVFAWCEANNAHYYAADREDFSYISAAFRAEEAGKTVVVAEDLS